MLYRVKIINFKIEMVLSETYKLLLLIATVFVSHGFNSYRAVRTILRSSTVRLPYRNTNNENDLRLTSMLKSSMNIDDTEPKG